MADATPCDLVKRLPLLCRHRSSAAVESAASVAIEHDPSRNTLPHAPDVSGPSWLGWDVACSHAAAVILFLNTHPGIGLYFLNHGTRDTRCPEEWPLAETPDAVLINVLKRR